MFNICPLHLGACLKVKQQTQAGVTVESPRKVNPSPLNSLMPRCAKHTDIPLRPAEAERVLLHKTGTETRVFIFPLKRKVACSIKNIVCKKKHNCVFQHQPCSDAGVVLVMTISGRLGRDVKCTYNLSIIGSVYKRASVLAQNWSNNKQGRYSLGTSSLCSGSGFQEAIFPLRII